MKKLRLWFVLSLIVASSQTFAETPWGGTEIGQAAQAAMAAFQEAEGETAFASVTGVAIERNTQGISAKAKVSFKQGTTNSSKSYFCHRHEGEIDCH